MGKAVVIVLLLSAALAGGGLWYTATRAFYAPVEGPVTLTLSRGGDLTALPAEAVSAIASTSSPLGFRACFRHGLDLAAASKQSYQPGATVGAALIEAGEARAFTAYENVAYGVDRVVALAADGRGWAWHELNDCGEKAYDGTLVGSACPDRDSFIPLTEGSL